MRRLIAVSIAAAFFALAGGTALADDVPASDVLYKKTTKYDMEAEDVDGARAGPGGLTFFTKSPVRHGSLIRVRTHFVPEMLRSANDI